MVLKLNRRQFCGLGLGAAAGLSMGAGSWGNRAIKLRPIMAPATHPAIRKTPFCKDSDALPVAAINITVVAAVCG